MNFLGRAQEKKVMHQALGCTGVQVLLIYGRRRVGKSELIKQVLRESKVKGIYYESKQTTEMNNVASLSNLISEFYNYPKLSFDNFEAVLDFLFKKNANAPLILVLDEYPYLRAAIPGLDSILQTLIDKYRDNSSLKLILCGSFIDVMKSLLLSENPLYGRVDRTIDLKPMDYYESSLFYSSYSNEDKIRLYSVFGGIPYYNKLIDSRLSVRENIIELIASYGGSYARRHGKQVRSSDFFSSLGSDRLVERKLASKLGADKAKEFLSSTASKSSSSLSFPSFGTPSKGPAVIEPLRKPVMLRA